MGCLLEGLEVGLEVFQLLLALHQSVLQIGLNQPVGMDISVELLHLRLAFGQLFSEFAIFVEQGGVLLQQQRVFDLKVFGGAEPQSGGTQLLWVRYHFVHWSWVRSA